MLYHIVKPIIKIALLFFCYKKYTNTKKYANAKGPLLLAVNHPNSFLDAIIIGVQFKQPVYFLARGDAFKKPLALKLLTALKCIPIYRLREGKEYLHLNENSFDKCREIFKKNGIVLIFTEGLCVNEWNIRPLKKGTARLAFSSWQMLEIGNNLKVLPVGINYNTFNGMAKKVWINYGDYITYSEFDITKTEGENFAAFNEKIVTQWKTLCVDGITNNKNNLNAFSCYLNTVANNDFTQITKKVASGTFTNVPILINKWHNNKKQNLVLTLLLSAMALPALLFVFPFYKLVQQLVFSKAKKAVHYDSILFGLSTLMAIALIIFYTITIYLICQQLFLSFLIICLLTLSCYFLTKCYVLWCKFFNHNKLKIDGLDLIQ